MINYQLPKFGSLEPKPSQRKKANNLNEFLIFVVLISSVFGFLAGMFSSSVFNQEAMDVIGSLSGLTSQNNYISQTSQEKTIIDVVKKSSPSVVSIIISKEKPVYEEYYVPYYEEFFGQPFFEYTIPQYRQKGVEKQQVGGGTGFIVSEDGMVLTNKHVVLDEDAYYSVLTSDNKEYEAEVLAVDPYQDIAILKIKTEQAIAFPAVKLGDSDKIEIGQSVIAIGYVLGRYPNTISVGVVSGLGRTITAGGSDFFETLEDIIQTDAAINRGNSGGPLLNLKGEVIGINTAIDVEGQNIGFTVPINKAKRDIDQVKTTGKIAYPFLGIRYIMINEEVKKEKSLSIDYGALIVGSSEEPAIFPGSAAEKVGLKEGDIILEFNKERVTIDNPLTKILEEYSPGDQVSLKIKRGEQELIFEAVLGER